MKSFLPRDKMRLKKFTEFGGSLWILRMQNSIISSPTDALPAADVPCSALKVASMWVFLMRSTRASVSSAAPASMSVTRAQLKSVKNKMTAPQNPRCSYFFVFRYAAYSLRIRRSNSLICSRALPVRVIYRSFPVRMYPVICS